MYYDYAMAAPYMAGVHEKDSLDVLILGMGTGTYAVQCSRYFDNLNFEGVEIDEKIIDLSRKYFDLPDSVSVELYDGRAYLNAADKTYDIIMVDAYQDITIPFQMSTVEFFTLVKDHLNDGGVMVMNMNMKTGGDGGINSYLSDTVSSVFGSVYTVDVSRTSNVELFASAADPIERMELNVSRETDPELSGLMERVKSGLVKYTPGDLIMTDDKAPVELLGMRAIDALIFDEVGYYRTVFKTGGIKGLIRSLS